MRRILRGLLLVMTDVLLRVALCISTPGIFAQSIGHVLRKDRRYASGGMDMLDTALQEAARDMELPQAHRQAGYGQEGEDLILMRLFEGRQKGFYVDVGAHHPVRFSNTYLLHRRGWRGINIDAMPGAMQPFHRLRPGDVNLEVMVSSGQAPCTFFVFDEPALNTASAEVLRMRQHETPHHKVSRAVTITPRPLSAILDEHVPDGVSIDLLNVDVEGLDLEVLESNDWQRYRPEIIVAEILAEDLSTVQDTELCRFLAGHRYRLVAKLYNSAIFRRMD